jgi:hypothetical protein
LITRDDVFLLLKEGKRLNPMAYWNHKLSGQQQFIFRENVKISMD